ncbi:MAG TPA: histidine kinase dimerization/phosphoacceptor domain -containing protein [Bacteroidia bacterium]|nr:GAF domain-containing protein [Bacteroidia bacterium]HRD39092.1 histidine kinase dimerization/phosphoacceptor domain -containing protein [Bacteroidia bacterium]
MLDKSVNLLEELDSISKIHFLKRDDIDDIMIEFSKRILVALKIERISVWLFNPDKTAIISAGEYDLRSRAFKKNSVLTQAEHPHYFEAINHNKILLVPNTYKHVSTEEFTDDYLKPNDIISLMDIPLRIEGELIGVMCFEKTGKTEKEFTDKEQTFAFSIALVFTSNMEARHRRAAQHKLEQALHEKDLLIKEINHRVKNNFSILISLLRIRKNQSHSPELQNILEEYEQRIFSMMKIQDLLSHSENYTSVNVSDYLNELIKEFKSTHPEIASNIESNIIRTEHSLPTKNAIHLGLLVTEIFINSFKYAHPSSKNYKFSIGLSANKNQVSLMIGDNGGGFDFKKLSTGNTLGLPLIKDLSENIDAKSDFPTTGNGFYKFLIQTSI